MCKHWWVPLVMLLAATALTSGKANAQKPTPTRVEGALRAIVEGSLSDARLHLGGQGFRTLVLPSPARVVAGVTAEEKALAVIEATAELTGLEPQQASQVEVLALRRPHSSPLVHVDCQRVIDGIRVAAPPTRVSLTANGRLLSVSGALPTGVVKSRVDLLGASLAGEIAAAALVRGAQPDRYAEQRWVIDPDGGLHLGWQVMVTAADGLSPWLVDVDGSSGQILALIPLTSIDPYSGASKTLPARVTEPHELTQGRSPVAGPISGPISGLVFDRSSPQPSATPGQVPPDPDPPELVDRVEVDFGGESTASPAGWVGPEQTSSGNNAIAREDHDGTWFTEGQLAVAADGVFADPLVLDGSSPLTDFSAAAAANAFYWVNWTHDKLYHLGFNESSGNFQDDNFGRGGVAGDRVRIGIQFAALQETPRYGSAFIIVPPDGQHPLINLMLSQPDDAVFTDPALDAEILVHEYTHGLTSRLGRNWYGHQAGAMNEGNSDFMALNLLLPSGCDPDGVFPAGSYVSQDFERGIRSRPYSTDEAVNELRYGDFGTVRGFPEMHSDGEIWVLALLEVRSRLIHLHGEEEGRQRVSRLLINALLLAPPQPSLVEARDAVLLAEQVLYGGEDRSALWQAFAERGLGFGAVTEHGNSLRVHESVETPDVAATEIISFADSMLEGGSAKIWVADASGRVTEVSATAVSGDAENLTLQDDGVLQSLELRHRRGPVVPGDGVLQAGAGEHIILSFPGADPREVLIRAAHDVSFGETGITAEDDETVLLTGSAYRPVPYQLPFDSDFAVTNRVVYVSRAGYLSGSRLEMPDSPGSRQRLADNVMVAPLWMHLRIDGEAQADEGVYVKQGDGWVRFRWAAETFDMRWQDGRLQVVPGVAVNFAATLHDDGRIVLTYGDGNTGLLQASPFEGGPTVGLGYGDGAVLVAGYDGAAFLDNAPSVHLACTQTLHAVESHVAIWCGANSEVQVDLPPAHSGMTLQVSSSDPEVLGVDPTLTVPAGQIRTAISVRAAKPGTSYVVLESPEGDRCSTLVSVFDLAPAVTAPGRQIVARGPFGEGDELVLELDSTSGISEVRSLDSTGQRRAMVVPPSMPAGVAEVRARFGDLHLPPRNLTVVAGDLASFEILGVLPVSPAPGSRVFLEVGGLPGQPGAELRASLIQNDIEHDLALWPALSTGGVVVGLPDTVSYGTTTLHLQWLGGGGSAEALASAEVEIGPALALRAFTDPPFESYLSSGARMVVSGVENGGLSAGDNFLRIYSPRSLSTDLEPIEDNGRQIVYRLPAAQDLWEVYLGPVAFVDGRLMQGPVGILWFSERAPMIVGMTPAELGPGVLELELDYGHGTIDDIRLCTSCGPRSRLLAPTSTDISGRHPRFVLPPDLCGGAVSLRMERRNEHTGWLPGMLTATVLPGAVVVPVVAANPGLEETLWRSDLALLNPTDQVLQPVISLADGSSRSLAIEAHSQQLISDLVGAFFGSSGSSWLQIEERGQLVVTSRTYNVGADGTYGQLIPGVRKVGMLPAAEPAEIIGLSETSRFRSNLALLNSSETPARVRVILRDEAGSELERRELELAAGERNLVQNIFREWAGVTSLETGRITVQLLEGSDIHAFASLIDNQTGDPMTVPAQTGSSVPVQGSHAHQLWIPAVSATPGVGGTAWRSDLVLGNPGERAAVVTLELRGNTSTPPISLELAAGHSVRLSDVVGDGGFQRSGNGAVRVQSDRVILALARVYNQSATGSFGQVFAGTPCLHGLRSGETGLLPMLRGPDEYRSNLGLVNTTGEPQRIEIEVYGPSGSSLASSAVSLSAGQWRQLAGVMPAASGWARVTIAEGEGPVLVYGSVVDNFTGDPTTIDLVR